MFHGAVAKTVVWVGLVAGSEPNLEECKCGGQNWKCVQICWICWVLLTKIYSDVELLRSFMESRSLKFGTSIFGTSVMICILFVIYIEMNIEVSQEYQRIVYIYIIF